MYNQDFEQFNINTNYLVSLGFGYGEINELQRLRDNGIKITSNSLAQCGYTYEQIQRLRYMYNICTGRVSVDSEEQLKKHLKKLNNHKNKITMSDLKTSDVDTVPRVAVVGNINKKPYDIWNSSNYNGKDAFYKVSNVSGKNITIETSRKPVLARGSDKKIPGMLEIKGVKSNGNAVVSFSDKYCRLCNRYIIVASNKRPEFHLGMYQILCFEGTKIYVYAKSIGTKEKINYSMQSQRVYDYGMFAKDIKQKVEKVAKQLYTRLNGVSQCYEGPNTNYKVVEDRVVPESETLVET